MKEISNHAQSAINKKTLAIVNEAFVEFYIYKNYLFLIFINIRYDYSTYFL